ncbi:MAG: hypothetical protein PHZ19_12055 [Candidatus Thermoplasmatota archaeon]|nr:hypothetical protein [Candidatus Thermoplasmatota archaeon]
MSDAIFKPRKLDAIELRGVVDIRQGKKYLCRNARNHFVDGGLKGIISTIIFNNVDHGYWYGPANTWNIYIGSDTVTSTVTTRTELQSPIGVAPGTAPDIKSITGVHDGGSDGDWYATWQATWNPGTVSGTLGETALYMSMPDKTAFGWGVKGGYSPPAVMVSRLSNADGDFSSFSIDDTKPLTIDWTVHLQFA